MFKKKISIISDLLLCIWIETTNDCSLILSTFLTFSILIWHFSLIFRSAIWIEADNDCSLMDVDRHVLAGTTSFQPQPGKAFKRVSKGMPSLKGLFFISSVNYISISKHRFLIVQNSNFDWFLLKVSRSRDKNCRAVTSPKKWIEQFVFLSWWLRNTSNLNFDFKFQIFLRIRIRIEKQICLFVSWENLWLDNFVSRPTDLYTITLWEKNTFELDTYLAPTMVTRYEPFLNNLINV